MSRNEKEQTEVYNEVDQLGGFTSTLILNKKGVEYDIEGLEDFVENG